MNALDRSSRRRSRSSPISSRRSRLAYETQQQIVGSCCRPEAATSSPPAERAQDTQDALDGEPRARGPRIKDQIGRADAGQLAAQAASRLDAKMPARAHAPGAAARRIRKQIEAAKQQLAQAKPKQLGWPLRRSLRGEHRQAALGELVARRSSRTKIRSRRRSSPEDKLRRAAQAVLLGDRAPPGAASASRARRAIRPRRPTARTTSRASPSCPASSQHEGRARSDGPGDRRRALWRKQADAAGRSNRAARTASRASRHRRRWRRTSRPQPLRFRSADSDMDRREGRRSTKVQTTTNCSP